MPISWNEIKQNAIRFSKEWKGEHSERAEAQTFWNEFFEVFGVHRRTVASFEEPVRGLKGKYKFIDLFWRGILLAEHKTLGEDLDKAKSQAFQYIQYLATEGRHDEIPRYVIISDFQRFVLYDLEPEDPKSQPLFGDYRVSRFDCSLSELYKAVHAFAFIPGYKQHRFEDQDPINIKAAEKMGRLHDALEAGGYEGHELERFLVRILFCLFAEDTSIFERETFRLYIENHTKPDGSDLGMHLARLFQVLNRPENKRQKTINEDLAAFPYVNGDLFAENLSMADMDREMRNALLACTEFDWSCISPAIFGSLFQSVMEQKERRQIGAHYTSERDILKVIRGLFLDDLREEFERVKNKNAELARFHEKVAKLKFLDPACGCGNFLVIAYRELRQLEIEVLLLLHKKKDGQLELSIEGLSKIDVDAFHGIEIGEWPTRIAEVAMWLMDHQMNQKLSEAFGLYFRRLPLKKSPHIVCANALRIDWNEVLPAAQCSYVLGNPPFVGKQFASSEQKQDMALLFSDISGSGILDYVAGWYLKAAKYIQGTLISVGFVSTNSICQGEQVGILWSELFKNWKLKIHFGHRTFSWASEARGKAHVHVVIVGFGAFDVLKKRIFDYEGDSITVADAKNISPYLVDGGDTVARTRSSPICRVPEIVFGNMPNDGGHLLLSSEEKTELIKKEPSAARFIKKFLGSVEFINGLDRWCIWLAEASPNDLRSMPVVQERVKEVRAGRLKSTRAETRELAKAPALFGEIRQPKAQYLAIPKTSSERRTYIPIAFLDPGVIASTELFMLENANYSHFGILSSSIHMSWVRQVCGRLKSDYRYSASLVYNNFPWPEDVSEKNRKAVEEAAQAVLDARKAHPKSTLADLYDPLTMPPNLVKAHDELDRAVDRCYRPQPFANERLRVEFLFKRYEDLVASEAAEKEKGAPKKEKNAKKAKDDPKPKPEKPAKAAIVKGKKSKKKR